GIGPQTAARFNAAGLARIGQIAATPVDLLELLVGRLAPSIRNFALGIDPRPIVPVSSPAQSYSQQETFPADTTDESFLEATLRRMADHLMAKIRADRKCIRTLTVRARYNDMAEDQASESLDEPTCLESDLYPRLDRLLRQAWKRRVSLRLVALKLSNVYNTLASPALPLDRPALQHAARLRLAAAVDHLRHARGHQVILHEHDFTLSPAHRGGEGSSIASRRTESLAPAHRGGEGRERGHSLAREILSPSNRSSHELTSHEPPPSPQPPSSLSIHVPPPSIPLAVHSYYSFLNSTLSPETIVALAARYNLPAVALTDTHNLHGAVEFFQAARQAGIRPILGAELEHPDHSLYLYVENAAGYRNLCHILSRIDALDPSASPLPMNRPPLPAFGHPLPRSPRGRGQGEGTFRHAPLRHWLASFDTAGLVAISSDSRLAGLFPNRFYLDVDRSQQPPPPTGPRHCPAVALLPIHYAEPADRFKFDVLQSIRTCTLLRQAHPDKSPEGSFHFPPPTQMPDRFASDRTLLDRTREIADRCSFEFPFGPPQFPPFAPPDGSSAPAFLRARVLEGLRRRYPDRHPQIQPQIEHELAIISQVGYAEYFLVVWDILQECRRRGIDWITRGSAADSIVCYCLEISNVCPIRFGLYFQRFLNPDRMRLHKLPDIDIDFPHDRKDDVIDLIFEKYGAAHAAIVGGFSTFQGRSAVAEIAKVLGASEFQIRRFTEHFPWAGARDIAPLVQQSLECRDLPMDEDPYRTALELAAFLDGFPRYPKMHPCGVVLSRQPMAELTPTFRSLKGYPTTHFDMDAVEAIGLVKIDILAQGGLAVMRDARESLERQGVSIRLDQLEPWADPAVWDMIANGGSRAVHHIESPAMVGLCRQSNVHDIDGLIAIVSVIRPGAANEQNKVRFTRRYQGLEPVTYPHPSLESCLQDAFGLVIYEEHILQICERFAGLPPGRADVLRRALNRRKLKVIDEIQLEFRAAARARGHPDPTIDRVWELVSGFAGYAFCKAHSTAYGVEAYQSAWLKHYHPAEFMAAVLSNGKGFYHPLVYILECHRLGIRLLPPWINQPGPAFTPVTDPPHSIRVPVTRVKGLSQKTIQILLRKHARKPFASLEDFYRRVSPSPEEMEALLRVGAFDGFGPSRTAQYWEYRHLHRSCGYRGESGQGWLFPPEPARTPEIPLEEPTPHQRLEWETDLLDFPVSGHPIELYDHVAWETYCPVSRLDEFIGQRVVACGLVIEQRLHHQITGEPMKFLTLADWTGIVETELFASTYRRYGLATVRYPVLAITATVEPYENRRGF
ncbi:MAG TPA: DNA polymerase III subunit alpha, partial [Candidatus Paceibacterota bacterium]|nr:DNA polymerase III subunit alpha [Candidatus Paceibacterota bacterium]